jgi:hypothetical protein
MHEKTEVNNVGEQDPLENVDLARRQALRSLLVGTVIAVPVVASFSIRGLGIKQAYAQTTGAPVCYTPSNGKQATPCKSNSTI